MTIAELQARAALDPELRTALLRDPRAALAAHGVQIPDGVNVRSLEMSPGELVVAVPPLHAPEGNQPDGAISDEALVGVGAGLSLVGPKWGADPGSILFWGGPGPGGPAVMMPGGAPLSSL